MRWGRVGYKGQTSLTPCDADLDAAKAVFAKKFADKTRNAWEERGESLGDGDVGKGCVLDGFLSSDSFEKAPGKYDLVKMDYSADEADSKVIKKEEEEPVASTSSNGGDPGARARKDPEKMPESKLHPAVQELVRARGRTRSRIVLDTITCEQ